MPDRDPRTFETWRIDGRWPSAVQDETGRLTWRVPATDLGTAGELAPAHVAHVEDELGRWPSASSLRSAACSCCTHLAEQALEEGDGRSALVGEGLGGWQASLPVRRGATDRAGPAFRTSRRRSAGSPLAAQPFRAGAPVAAASCVRPTHDGSGVREPSGGSGRLWFRSATTSCFQYRAPATP